MTISEKFSTQRVKIAPKIKQPSLPQHLMGFNMAKATASLTCLLLVNFLWYMTRQNPLPKSKRSGTSEVGMTIVLHVTVDFCSNRPFVSIIGIKAHLAWLSEAKYVFFKSHLFFLLPLPLLCRKRDRPFIYPYVYVVLARDNIQKNQY